MKNQAPPPEQLFEMVFGRSFPDSLRATTMPRQLPSDLFLNPASMRKFHSGVIPCCQARQPALGLFCLLHSETHFPPVTLLFQVRILSLATV